MSIHATIHPELRKKIIADKKKSLLLSTLLAAFSIIIILGGLILFTITIKNKQSIKITAIPAPENVEDLEDEVEETTQQSAEQPEAKPPINIITPTISNSNIAVAVNDNVVELPSDISIVETNDIGESDEILLAAGDQSQIKSIKIAGLDPIYTKRCSHDDRVQRVTALGGDPAAVEAAIINSLDYMQNQQNVDGSFYRKNDENIGLSAMTLLCFLGHCETTDSKAYGETVERAVMFLVNQVQKNKGYIPNDIKTAHSVYVQAFGVYALCEAYTLFKSFGIEIDGLALAVKQSANVLIHAQNKHGGWSYDITGRATTVDNSVSSAVMQALKAYRLTKLENNPLDKEHNRTHKNVTSVANKYLNYVAKNQTKSGVFIYKIGQQNTRPRHATTTYVTLAFFQWGRKNNRAVHKALQWIDTNIEGLSYHKGGTASALMSHYYLSQIMVERGGRHWKKYHNAMKGQLERVQNADGSFPKQGKVGKVEIRYDYYNNKNYRTILACLILESYYRFLPSTS